MESTNPPLALNFQALSIDNINAVYAIFEQYEPFYQMPVDYFRRGTLGDEGFDADLVIVATLTESTEPIAFIIAVHRGRDYVLRACLVVLELRYKGIGTRLMQELLLRIKHKSPKHASIRFGDSPARYWTPGVDQRHTALIFFLEKMGFKRQGQRQNLTVDLTKFDQIPHEEKNGYYYSRVTPEEADSLRKFISGEFWGTWDQRRSDGARKFTPNHIHRQRCARTHYRVRGV